MSQTRFLIELTLVAPLQTKATNVGEYGVDSPCARTPDGKLYLPGTLIKGKVREAWTWLKDWQQGPDEKIGTWFGSATGDAARLGDFEGTSERSFTPSAGRVRFGDLFLQGPAPQSALRTRIRIDPDSGAAAEGMLQVLESPFAPDSRVAFSGYATFDGTAAEALVFEKALHLALRATTTVGAHRAIGFGRIEKAAVKAVSALGGCDWSGIHGNERSVRLSLSTEDAICVAEKGPALNVFHSGSILGGNIIKGALAAQLQRRHGVDPSKPDGGGDFPTLRKHFSRMRIRQALPATAECGTTIVPQSLYTFPDGDDKVTVRDTVLRNDPPRDHVPSFQVDWKEKDECAICRTKKFPNVVLRRDLRVRTAIEAKNRRAEDEKLFAYELVLPQTTDGTPVHWETVVDLDGADLDGVKGEERHRFWKELGQALEGGLCAVGKTKALFSVNAAPESPPGLELKPGEPIAVMLRSPALLGNPDWIKEKSGADDLFAFYEDYWNAAAPGSLKLKWFFARQDLLGGVYQYRRFQCDSGPRPYRPWFITCTGSVFVFEATDMEKARDELQKWLKTGLPLVGGMREFYGLSGAEDPGDDWRRCPYVPANGFGEIAVNAHEAWRDLCR